MLPFQNENGRTSHSIYYLPKVEIKNYNVMRDGRNFFDQPINSMNKKMLEKSQLVKVITIQLVAC